MPRAYNEQERERITRKLMDSGEERFVRFGLKKTTVDDLVQDAGIAKGSFYQFFDSKESLFFAIQEKIESELKENLIKRLDDLISDPAIMIKEFFKTLVNVLEQHPFLKLITDPEIFELLIRNISPQQLMEHRRIDELFYKNLFRKWIRKGLMRNVNVDTLFGTITALVLLHQQRAILGDQFKTVMGFLVDSVCCQLIPETRKSRSR